MAGEGDTGDLLMMILPKKGGKALEGESSSKLTSNSPLLKGFRPNEMFEISGFKFGVQSEREDEVEKKIREAAAKGRPLPHAAGHQKQASISPTSTTGEARSCPVKEVTFDRPIDRSSPILLRYFVESTTMYGAVVVKRKPAGGPLAGEPYLRLEFIGVLFIHVQWSNEDPIKENCTFITRAVNVMYKPQLPNGTLGATCNGYWSQIPNRHEELSC